MNIFEKLSKHNKEFIISCHLKSFGISFSDNNIAETKFFFFIGLLNYLLKKNIEELYVSIYYIGKEGFILSTSILII